MSDAVFRPTSLQLSLAELINHMAHHLWNESGRHAIVSITVTEDFGLAVGIPPGGEAVFNVSTGPVVVRSARSL